MRLVVSLLAFTLTGSLAFADEANVPEPKVETAKAKVGLRVVRILPESHQALLFDRNRGTHVLADVGSSIAGYTVEDIDDDEVTLTANGKELVLAGPDESWRRRATSETPRPRVAVKRDAAPVDPYATETAAPADPYAEEAPVDPYADPKPTTTTAAAKDTAKDAPVDPYAEPEVRTVTAPAPITAGEGGVRIVDAGPPPALTDPTAPALPAIDPPGTPPPPPPITPTVLSRSELNASLADFGKLTSLLRGTFTPAGARLDVVAPGSVFAKAGLKPGDVVTTVDTTPIRSIDDAAELYVRASSTKAANIQILRAGKPLTLRVLLQ